jgi:hypothetical protein
MFCFVLSKKFPSKGITPFAFYLSFLALSLSLTSVTNEDKMENHSACSRYNGSIEQSNAPLPAFDRTSIIVFFSLSRKRDILF